MRIYGLFIAALLVALSGCDRQNPALSTQPVSQSAPATRPTLAASVFPIADLVQRVAGERWQVVTLLPPGRNPHGYSLRPAEAQSLAKAKVLFAAGLGLDGWAIRAAHGINPQCQVIVLTEALGLTESASSQSHGGPAEQADESDGPEPHAHPGMDPHLWLDPLLAGRIAELASWELTRLDPDGREVYEKNLAGLKQQITSLDDDYRTTLASCRVRQLVVFHPGYGYLARRYGLEQVSIVPGAGANPGQVEQAIDLIKRDRIPAVYREPQFDSRWVEFVSRRSGAKVLVLDPQGHAAKKGYDSYFAMMRTNLAQLKEGLDCGH